MQKLFINQRWQEGHGDVFRSHNPATGDLVWEGREANDSDVTEAFNAARKAFPGWSSLPLEKRTAFIEQFKDKLKQNEKKFAETISRETGKPLWESQNEIQSMINKIDISIRAYQQRCPDVYKNLPQAASVTRHKPHGVLLVLGPFNFPNHLPNGHIVPALLAGNTLVFKPSEKTPLSAEMMIHAWEEAGLPAGVINLVQGGATTGKLCLNNAELDGALLQEVGKQEKHSPHFLPASHGKFLRLKWEETTL